MKLLVMSDSHSGLSFMRYAIEILQPDAMIHLGDHFEDGEAMAEEFPEIPMYQVAGNCDAYRSRLLGRPEILVEKIGGAKLYLTHGHKHNVKLYLGSLIQAGDACRAQAVLYGHTHSPDCFQENGMWVLNPGSCGSWGGTVGLMEVEDGEILDCRVLTREDLEAMI